MATSILPQSNKPVRYRKCGCGKEFEVQTRGQRSCPGCLEAKAAALAARPPKLCRDCHKVLEVRTYDRCEECREAKQEAERKSKKRRNHIVETHIHTLMLRHNLNSGGNKWEDFSLQHQRRIERYMAEEEAKIARRELGDFYMFVAKLVIVAMRRGLLTPLQWDYMRLPGFTSISCRDGLEELGRTIFGRDFTFHSTKLNQFMPILDAEFNDPSLSAAKLPIPSQTYGPKSNAPQYSDPSTSADDSKPKLLLLALMLANRLVEQLNAPTKANYPEPETLNPEQVAADDQEAIDTAFFALMEGFEL